MGRQNLINLPSLILLQITFLRQNFSSELASYWSASLMYKQRLLATS